MYEANSKAAEIQHGTGFFIEDYVAVGDLVVQIQEFVAATKEPSLTFLLAKSDGIFGLGFQEILVGNVVHVWYNMVNQGLVSETTRFCASGCNAIVDLGTSMLAGLTGIIVQINHAIGESWVVNQECKDVVSEYGDKIIDMLLANEQPKRICSQIDLCMFDGTQGVSMRIESVVNQNVGKASSTLCDFICSTCEMTIVWMQNQLKKNQSYVDLTLDMSFIDPVMSIWIDEWKLLPISNAKLKLNMRLYELIYGTSKVDTNLFRGFSDSGMGMVIRKALVVEQKLSRMDANGLVGSNTQYGFIHLNLNLIDNGNPHCVAKLSWEIFDPGGIRLYCIDMETILLVHIWFSAIADIEELLLVHILFSIKAKRAWGHVWSNHPEKKNHIRILEDKNSFEQGVL
ncbi:hypothetical protein GQ457_05G027790 [Hibiscus cannabinus]